MRRLSAGALATALAMASAGPARAQSVGADYARVEGVAELAERCALGAPGRIVACRELALAAMAVQQAAGLVATSGSDVPGTSSTHGRRQGTVPRFGLSLSAAAARSGMPRVVAGTGPDLSRSQTVNLTAIRAHAAAGVLNGFQIAPAVGGILSLDAVAFYSRAGLPADAGLSGDGEAVGVGARVGILRESFTVPGISVSATRSWHDDVDAGPADASAPGRLSTTGLTVSSLRATAGKNWFVIGLLGGVGWDRYEGHARISTGGGQDELADAAGALTSERVSYFVSGWFNFLLTRLSLEVGLAEGVAVPFDGRAADFDPSSASWFASLAFRATL